MDTTVNLRIDADLKIELEELANQNDQSLSQYLREILNDHVDASCDYQEDFDELQETITLTGKVNIEYEKTFGFTYLLTWLFCKQMHPIETNNKEVIKSIKDRVELAIYESAFSQELKLEFVKVLNDINRFLVEPDYDNKQFVFSIPNHHLSFDYYKLMNEIWSLKH